MRVAIFVDTYLPEINGVATSTFTLKEVLKKNGHDVLLVTTNPFSKKLILEDDVLRIPGFRLKRIYNYRFANILTRRIKKYLYAFSPDIVHVHTELSVGVLGRSYARRTNKPIVYTYHTMYEDYSYYVTKGHFDPLVRKIIRFLTRRQVEGATEFIAPSLKTRDHIRLSGIDSYINIVPTGIDFSRFKIENVDQSRLTKMKEEYNIKKDDFVLLSLGRIAKEKSIDVLIKAVSEYKAKNPQIKVKFLIVGDGPFLLEAKKMVKDLNAEDYIIFTGSTKMENTPYFYHLANVFISASLSETQGLTYMEAMASSIYVLARYDFNLLNVIEEDKTGFYFENYDDFITKLEHIRLLISKGDKRILENALKNISSYSLESFYLNIMEVYERAIKKSW